LRKVQLYPAQSGNLVIDKMSVHNAIEYADSVSGKAMQTTIVLESEPITIAVKPLPATTLQDFTGAVGTFSINAYLEKEQWRENGNGKLKVRIKGNGNFVQLTAPDIHWPRGVDMFEPAATERLQKEAVPVSGTRTYTYTLTADSTGAYAIPPIGFTYFDVAAKKYKTIGTDSIYFTVLKASSKSVLPLSIRKRLPGSQGYMWWLAAVGVLAIGSIVLFWKYRRRHKPVATPRPERSQLPPDFEKQVRDLSSMDTQAYRILQQSLMGFLKSWNPGAVTAAHGSLQQVAAALPSGPQIELQTILEECEAVQYYNAAPTVPFSELQQRALQFMQSLKQLRAPERR
jgi:hypothetical protein